MLPDTQRVPGSLQESVILWALLVCPRFVVLLANVADNVLSTVNANDVARDPACIVVTQK